MLDRSITSDPLSDILSLLKPRNMACGAVDAGEACIFFPEGHGIKCHAVTAGEAWLVVDGVAAPLHLGAGDCFILAHGRSYQLASDPRLAPVDYRIVLAGRAPGQVTAWNGGGRATIISATFTIEERHAGMLRDILPPIAHVREDDDQPGLRRSLHQMMEELGDPQPGSRLIVEHLATMMLAQALRAYALHAGSDQVGWLFALADRQIGAAIGALHANPAHRWTVRALAERVGMSRTSFAVRFRRSVGSAPMQYLTRLRMLLASDRLFNSDDAIHVVADAFGYESESAFSNAFKRHLGHSPRRFIKAALPTM
jgi:AraC-like DNA-binding protein